MNTYDEPAYVWMPFTDGTFGVVAPDGQVVREGLDKAEAETLVMLANMAFCNKDRSNECL
jgi:hypothetical protein